MKELLVLGIGNRLMMDDGVGVLVVEALAARRPVEAIYAVGETDVDYCLDLALLAPYLILVDAAATGRAPGTVTTFPLGEVTAMGAGLSLHHVHLLDLLHQHQPRKRGALIGIEPYRVDFHWGLSGELAERWDQILTGVEAAIAQAARAPSSIPCSRSLGL